MKRQEKSQWPFFVACTVVGFAAALLPVAWDAPCLTIVQVAALVMVVAIAPRVLHKGQYGIGGTMLAAALFGFVFMGTLCFLDFGFNYLGFSTMSTLTCAAVMGFGGCVVAMAVTIVHLLIASVAISPHISSACLCERLSGRVQWVALAGARGPLSPSG